MKTLHRCPARLAAFVMIVSIPAAGHALACLDFTGSVTLLDRIPAPDYAMAITSTTRHLLVSGNGLTIFDIRNPGKPEFIRYFDIGFIDDTLVENGYAYVCGSSGFLRIFDLYGAAGPDSVSYMPAPHWNFTGYAIRNGFVYLQSPDYSIGLITVDARDPYHPTVIDRAPEIHGFTIKIVGTRIYNSWNGLLIVDISDPGHPSLASQMSFEADCREFAYNNGILWVDCHNYPNPRIRAYSLSDPDNPTILTDMPAAGYLRSLSANGDQLTVCYQDRGIQIFDIDTPEHPQLRLDLPAVTSYKARRAGSKLYLITPAELNSPYEIRTYDLGSLRTPQPGEVLATARRLGDRFDDLLITGSQDGRIRISRILAGAVMEDLALIDTDYLPVDLAVRDGLLYTVTYSSIMSVYDISDPTTPFLLGWDVPWDQTTSITVTGSRAYSGGVHHGLQIRNIENPARPRHTAYMSYGSAINDVTGVPGYVLAITNDAKLLAIDIADQDTPAIAGSLNLGVVPCQIRLLDGIAFIATASCELLAVDVGDPLNPVIVGTVEHGGGTRFVIDGTVAAVVSDKCGAVFIDISDPRNMVVMGQYLSLSPVNSIQPLGGAFLLNNWSGTSHVVFQPCVPTTRIGDDVRTPERASITVSPNPFNPRATVSFEAPGYVAARLDVLDLRGHLVATLYDAVTPRGAVTIDWDGRDAGGAHLSSGVYQLNLTIGNITSSQKITILK